AAPVDGALDLLGALHLTDRAVRPLPRVTWLAGAGARVAADSAGMFFARVPRDTRVRAGDVVGTTTDYLGRKTGDVRAPIDGLVTFVRGVPSMWPRATLVNVAPVLDAPPPWKRPTP
ncbi:MAG: hypothetical protein JO180_04720, partial [Gemmatirosa sp.]|nr:hypothetical protein [Gemmatirosa sp.]